MLICNCKRTAIDVNIGAKPPSSMVVLIEVIIMARLRSCSYCRRYMLQITAANLPKAKRIILRPIDLDGAERGGRNVMRLNSAINSCVRFALGIYMEQSIDITSTTYLSIMVCR